MVFMKVPNADKLLDEYRGGGIVKHAACNPHLINLCAFITLLGAIVTLSLAGKATDLAIMTGLIGVLGTFRPWTANPAPTDSPAGTDEDPVKTEITNSPNNPANVQEQS
jgi:hypothetical protein